VIEKGQLVNKMTLSYCVKNYGVCVGILLSVLCRNDLCKCSYSRFVNQNQKCL